MLVFPSLGSQAEAAQNRTQRLRMSVEQHTLYGKAEEVNIFLAALLNFTSCLRCRFWFAFRQSRFAIASTDLESKNVPDLILKFLVFNILPRYDPASYL